MTKQNLSMIQPGSRLGVFGGGQLGRMFAHAAQRLGYRVVVFTPETDSPAGQVAQETIQADYEDPKAVRRFAEAVDVITLEFENISLEAIARAEEIAPVRPGYRVLSIAQHRIREKSTLAEAGFPVTPFVELNSPDDVSKAAAQLGYPMVFKTSQWGYDGKGQRKVHQDDEAHAAFGLLGPTSVIAEKCIDFQAEVSMIAARSPRGELAIYPMFYNEHANHILDVTTCPAPDYLSSVGSEAERLGREVTEFLKVEGLLTIEFFVGSDGKLMINELAPRPHNSGHLTMEACRTSQFEQQVRAICNLPLGDTSLVQPAAMANLLGDVWSQGFPAFEAAMKHSSAYLHLYGKSDARQGRKMGHLTCLDMTSQLAADQAKKIRNRMRRLDSSLFD
jgi:5-(carboxyamino)imidazole ribonucleotide synthase